MIGRSRSFSRSLRRSLRGSCSEWRVKRVHFRSSPLESRSPLSSRSRSTRNGWASIRSRCTAIVAMVLLLFASTIWLRGPDGQAALLSRDHRVRCALRRTVLVHLCASLPRLRRRGARRGRRSCLSCRCCSRGRLMSARTHSGGPSARRSSFRRSVPAKPSRVPSADSVSRSSSACSTCASS